MITLHSMVRTTSLVHCFRSGRIDHQQRAMLTFFLRDLGFRLFCCEKLSRHSGLNLACSFEHQLGFRGHPNGFGRWPKSRNFHRSILIFAAFSSHSFVQARTVPCFSLLPFPNTLILLSLFTLLFNPKHLILYII